MPGMADGDPQAMELAVPQQPHNVAQPVLAAVTAVELEARDAGREIQLVVGDQHLVGFDLPVAQRGSD